MADMDVTAKFTADISDMKSKMDAIAKGMDSIRRNADSTGKGFTVLRGTIATAFGTALTGSITAATGALTGFLSGTISAASEAALADRRMTQIASSMGILESVLGGSTQRLSDFAQEMQDTTGVSDEVIKQGQALLLTFANVASSAGQVGGMFDRATQASVDLAAAGFGSVDSNAKQLGKALQDPIKGITALTRSGVTFTAAEKEKIKTLVESGKTLEAQEMIMKAVEMQVGGTAAATATGAQKMKAAMDDLQEAIGTAIFPVVDTMANQLIPVIQSLQAPLATVAAAVGGAMTQAFNALAPVLPVLATAIGQIVQVIAGALGPAIAALAPAFIPIIEAFQYIAAQVGPLLTTLLGKVAQVLSRVLGALTPLLKPLTDIFMGILDAAWPIIEVVADTLLILVDALTPLLDAVMVLLKPLGQLIQVVLAAILPVIKPLMPVIAALANVLGVVLMKAVGLIMAGLGGLIVALSKIAPFVLKNVTKPVVSAFLNMAKNVVGAASNMLGWVPGLGDSLKTAEAAISEFAVQTERSIGQAADTIATEGSRIGNEMITQGTNALNAAGPSLGAAASNLGKSVGAQYTDAVSRAMAQAPVGPPVPSVPTPTPAPTPSGTGSGSKEASKQEEERLKKIEKFVDGYKKALERMKEGRDALMASVKKSPFAEMLDDLEQSEIQQAFGKDGAVGTVIASYDQLSKAIDDFYQPLQNVKRFGKEAAASARRSATDAKNMLFAAAQTAASLMKQRELNKQALERLESDYSSAVDGINRTYDELDRAAAANLKAVEDKWAATIPVLERALETATAAFEKENDTLQSLIKERDSYLNRVAEGFRSFVNDLRIEKGADPGAASLREALDTRLEAVRAFATNIRALAARGLDPTLLRDFVSAGVSTAGDVVSQLAVASEEEIAGINAAQTALASEIASFQSYATQQWFAAGIAQQEAIVAPLAAARDQAQAALTSANVARAAEIAAATAHAEALRVQRQAALDQAKAQYEAQKAALVQQGVEIETALTENANMLHAGIANLQNTVPPEMFKAGKKSVREMLKGFKEKFPGMSAELNRMMDGLAASMNRTATITVRTVYEAANLPGRALGGPVSANKAYLVGERGPEVFVPGFAGNIIPNNQLGTLGTIPDMRSRNAMTTEQAVNIAAGAVQITINGSMDARSKDEIEAVVDEALLRLAREIRRS
jgi:phage-related protein